MEVNFKYEDHVILHVGGDVTVSYCMEVENVCQRSRCIFDRVCNLLHKKYKKKIEIACSVTLEVKKKRICQLFEK